MQKFPKWIFFGNGLSPVRLSFRFALVGGLPLGGCPCGLCRLRAPYPGGGTVLRFAARIAVRGGERRERAISLDPQSRRATGPDPRFRLGGEIIAHRRWGSAPRCRGGLPADSYALPSRSFF